MMGGTSYGSYRWMMSQAGYQWMTGSGTASPGWMAGGTLPAAMMNTGMMSTGMTGGSTDPGKVMGTLFANAPGPRVLVNADPDTAHGLVVTASSANASWMPMMTARPTFTGSALWFIGNPTSAGLHEGTITFAAATPGTYQYLCPVPGHARKGMAGTLTVGETRSDRPGPSSGRGF